MNQKQDQRQATPAPRAEPLPPGHGNASVNEPPGSNVGGEATPPPVAEPLVLTSIDPVSIVVGSAADFALTATGSGFDATCVILFDDEEFPATGDATTLTATIPVAAAPAIVDVEVARGEDLSDVLTFEFVAPAGTRSSQKAERKPKKAEPRGKRQKKDKKGKR